MHKKQCCFRVLCFGRFPEDIGQNWTYKDLKMQLHIELTDLQLTYAVLSKLHNHIGQVLTVCMCVCALSI